MITGDMAEKWCPSDHQYTCGRTFNTQQAHPFIPHSSSTGLRLLQMSGHKYAWFQWANHTAVR